MAAMRLVIFALTVFPVIEWERFVDVIPQGPHGQVVLDLKETG